MGPVDNTENRDGKELPDGRTKEFREVIQRDYEEKLVGLFQDALKKEPFGFICTMLRVSGIHFGHWDPLEESKEAFEDLRALLKESAASGTPKSSLRIGLLMYCHAVEMSAVHEMLMNLLRCRNGQPFIIKPFRALVIQKKKGNAIIPSAAKKFSELKKFALSTGEPHLASCIDGFFDDRIRNSFSHSDYCIAENSYRWTEAGHADQMPFQELNEKLTRASAFFETFFRIHQGALRDLASSPRYLQMPNYEVLELLSKDEELYGFKIHFSNGSSAHYTRVPGRVEAVNVMFETDGTINYMCGMLNELVQAWKVNGSIVTDWNEINR